MINLVAGQAFNEKLSIFIPQQEGMHRLKLEKIILIKQCESSTVRLEFKPKHEPEIEVV